MKRQYLPIPEVIPKQPRRVEIVVIDSNHSHNRQRTRDLVQRLFPSEEWVILEIPPSLKKDEYLFQCVGQGKFEKVPNPEYDPKYKTPRKPKFCPAFVQFICLEKKSFAVNFYDHT